MRTSNQRFTSDGDAFFAGMFLTRVGSDPHAFENVGGDVHTRNLVVHKFGVTIADQRPDAGYYRDADVRDHFQKPI